MTKETAEQNGFEGWCILEIFGHQKYAGYVSTMALGTACMFRLDVPALEERERLTTRPGYLGDTYAPAGTLVKENAVQGYTKLFGVGAIYAISPCSETAAIKAVQEIQPRPVMIIRLPEEKALEAPAATVRVCQDEQVRDEDEDEELAYDADCPCGSGLIIGECECPTALKWGEDQELDGAGE